MDHWFSLVSIGLLVALPFIFGAIGYRKQGSVTLEATQTKYGSLFAGIRHYKLMQVIYASFFLTRRLSFALVVIFLDDKPLLVVSTILILNLLEVSYICTV